MALTSQGDDDRDGQEPNVVDACTTNDRLDNLVKMGERLDSCQKSLSDYLDTKRAASSSSSYQMTSSCLPWFSDPTAIQIHLLKLFDNVKGLLPRAEQDCGHDL